MRRKLVVLAGRSTFSAAGNFVADVDRATRADLVGEPAGGAPSQWGDSFPSMLPVAGLTVHVADRVLGVRVRPATPRSQSTPVDIRVEPTAADFFAGRDPVLARALALPLKVSYAPAWRARCPRSAISAA